MPACTATKSPSTASLRVFSSLAAPCNHRALNQFPEKWCFYVVLLAQQRLGPWPLRRLPQRVHAQKGKNGVFTRCSCNVLQVSLPHGRHNAFKRFGLWLQTAVSPNTLVGDGSPVANTVQLVCAGGLAGGRQDILFSVLRFFLVARKALRSSASFANSVVILARASILDRFLLENVLSCAALLCSLFD